MPQWSCRAGLWAVCALLAACLWALPGGAGLAAAALLQSPAAALARPADASPEAVGVPAWPAAVPDNPPLTPEPPPFPEPETTDTPAPSPQPSAAPAPYPAGSGVILPQTIGHGTGPGSVSLAAGSIRNDTDLPDDTLAAAAAGGLPFAIDRNSAQPQILILHTHATETYQPHSGLWFDPAFTARTADTTQNMCAVGERMAQILNEAGIVTVHDSTLHDSPSYTESYARSADTARAWLEQYPSIKIVLDVHRDALGTEDTRIKPVCTIDGQDAAQVMLIAGCDNGASVCLPHWKQNLAFAAAWEARMESSFPGLTRPVLCGYRYYNQDLTTGSLLIEVGGHGNTLEEALRGAEYAARALAELLLS